MNFAHACILFKGRIRRAKPLHPATELLALAPSLQIAATHTSGTSPWMTGTMHNLMFSFLGPE